MHTDTDFTELLNVVPPSPLHYRSDASVTGHALAPVDHGLLAAYAAIDRPALRQYRLERIRQQLRKQDYAGVLLAIRSISATPPIPITSACG